MVQFEDFLARLKAEYPELKFRLGKKFMFRPPRSIYYVKPPRMTQSAGNVAEQLCQKDDFGRVETIVDASEAEQNKYFLQLLHEVGHALLGHKDFATDPERVKMECAAWQKAQELCRIYNIEYDEDFAEAELDTYRDWLHQKSLCKECGLTRYQTPDGVYHCPFCEEFRAKA